MAGISQKKRRWMMKTLIKFFVIIVAVVLLFNIHLLAKDKRRTLRCASGWAELI